MLEYLLKQLINLYSNSALSIKKDIGEDMKSLYKVKLTKGETPLKARKESEEMLKSLLKILPELKKYALEGEIQTKIRTLRNGRKSKHYTLELSRKAFGYKDLQPKTETTKLHWPKTAKFLGLDTPYIEQEFIVEQKPTSTEIRVSAPLTKVEVMEDGKKKRVAVNKTKVLSDLKSQIIKQIKETRKENKTTYENYTFHYGLSVPKLGSVYLEPKTFYKLIDKKVRYNMANFKKPTEKANYVGIELEFAAKENRDQVCDVLHAEGLGKYLHVHNDGSIAKDADFPNSHEISILVKETELDDIITHVCNILNDKSKLNIRVDKTCGLHVHLDMRTREVARAFSNLVMMQHFLFAMVPGNRKNGKYSVPVKDTKFDPGGIREREAHYDGINQSAYTKHRTIEIRMHCGTTQHKKIISWVKLLLAISDAQTIINSYTSLKDAQQHLNISNELIEYCDSRIAKFASQHKKVKVDWMTKVNEVNTPPDSANLEEQSEVA